VIRSAHAWVLGLSLVVAGGWTPAEAMQAQEPDSVYRIEPIMVRVLASTIGTATPYPVSVVAETLKAAPNLIIKIRFWIGS